MLWTTMCRVGCMLLSMVIAAAGQEPKVPDTPAILHVVSPSERFPAMWYPRVGDGTDVLPAPVTGHPYTALSGALAPGSDDLLKEQSPSFQARDRFGRTRNESESGGFTLGGQSVKTKTVLVSDPVSHCDFHWTQPVGDVEMPTDMRVAMVTCGPLTLRYKDADIVTVVMDALHDGVTHNGDTTSTVTHLAPVRMDGLLIQRLRVVNDRTDEHGQVRKQSTETWFSPELREIIRIGDEQGGFSGLSNIKLVDPDPVLGYLPKGYRIELQPQR